MTVARSIDEAPFPIDEDVYSESVLLAAWTADASAAVFTRLCRYPDAGVAWVWAHAFTASGSWTHVDDRAACSSERLDLAAADTVYSATPAVDAVWSRVGDRAGLTEARTTIDVPGLRIEATFEPDHAAGGTLPGRSEVLGRASVTVVAGDREAERFEGFAQWHEQEQSAPRFRVPFTYASLAGDGLALIALVGPRAAGGFVRGEGGARRITRASFEDGVELDVEDGTPLTGPATVAHDYRLPVYGRGWRGTFVRAAIDGRSVAGFVNRWTPEAPPYEDA